MAEFSVVLAARLALVENAFNEQAARQQQIQTALTQCQQELLRLQGEHRGIKTLMAELDTKPVLPLPGEDGKQATDVPLEVAK